MSSKVKFPSEFISLPILQEHFQDLTCKMCEDDIIGHSSNCSYYQCEGRHCDEAIENVINSKEHLEYEFVYVPSGHINLLERSLDLSLKAYALEVNIKFSRLQVQCLMFENNYSQYK